MMRLLLMLHHMVCVLVIISSLIRPIDDTYSLVYTISVDPD